MRALLCERWGANVDAVVEVSTEGPAAVHSLANAYHLETPSACRTCSHCPSISTYTRNVLRSTRPLRPPRVLRMLILLYVHLTRFLTGSHLFLVHFEFFLRASRLVQWPAPPSYLWKGVITHPDSTSSGSSGGLADVALTARPSDAAGASTG